MGRILIVDDEPDVGEVIAEAASSVGFDCKTLVDSDHLMEVFGTFRPDVLVLDLNMPGVDGVEALKGLACAENPAEVILCSAMDERTIGTVMRIAALHGVSVVASLTKPVDLDDLEAVLKLHLPENSEISSDTLAAAIENGEIEPFFQPKMKLGRNREWRAGGVEALARWRHPKWGMVSPGKFIPLAESASLMSALTKAMLDRALEAAAKLRRCGHDLEMSINVSPALVEDAGLPERIARQITALGLEPRRVIIEVTEDVALADNHVIMGNLTRFRLKGMKLSLDDFGTGYSSILQLFKLPFCELKIDRSFVFECETNPHAKVIVESIVEMAHKLGLTVCAEGVESVEVMEFLRAIGCDETQGFYFSKPLPFDELLCFLETNGAARAA